MDRLCVCTVQWSDGMTGQRVCLYVTGRGLHGQITCLHCPVVRRDDCMVRLYV